MKVTRSLAISPLPPKSTCIALGLFDGIHLGHKTVLETMLAASQELALEPMVFTFSTLRHAPAAKKGLTRLMSGTMMKRLLGEMGVSHMIWPDFDDFRGLTHQQFVQDMLVGRLGAGCVVCGYDFHFGKNAAGNPDILTELCGELGAAVRIVPEVDVDGGPAASRRIRELVRTGEIPAANRILGRPFAIDFEVIRGRQLGRTLNWPTINQPFPIDFTIPRYGVYATLTRVQGKLHSSVTNVGVKPTVGSDQVLAETYIQGFEGDLYSQRIQVDFLEFLRPEQKFPDLDSLRGQIASDAARAQGIAASYQKMQDF